MVKIKRMTSMRKLVNLWRGAPGPIKFLPGLFYRAVSPMLFPKGKQVNLDGVKFRVGVPTPGAYRRAIEFKYREGRFTTEFLAEARRASVIYDIGAHVGFYVLLAAKANPEARIVAFEPHRANLLELQNNIRRSAVDNAMVFSCGVSDGARAAQLTVIGSREHTGGGTHQLSDSESGECINTVALDDFAAEQGLPPPSLVLMDIEGHELAALRGMERLLSKHRPSLYIEVHREQLEARGESHEQLNAFLSELGYVAEILRSPSGERGTHSQLHVRYRVPELSA